VKPFARSSEGYNYLGLIMQTTVTLTQRETHWTLTLVAPGNKPPTIDYQVLSELNGALDKVAAATASGADDAPRCLVVESTSERCFCAGANISILGTLSGKTIADWVERGHAALNRLEDLPIPVVATVRGYALGGGLELALACDLIVCDRSAKLGLTEANIGFVPGWGGSFRLPRRVGVPIAKRMFYTAEMVEADSALSRGLADAVVEASELESWVADFSRNLAEKSEVGIRGFKTILNAQDRAARDANCIAEAAQSLECIGNPDTQRRINAFLEKRKS